MIKQSNTDLWQHLKEEMTSIRRKWWMGGWISLPHPLQSPNEHPMYYRRWFYHSSQSWQHHQHLFIYKFIVIAWVDLIMAYLDLGMWSLLTVKVGL
jgi:hypothetical protein